MSMGSSRMKVKKQYRNDRDSLAEVSDISVITDLALLSFLKIYTKINKYTHILEYRHNEFLKEITENFKVNMGFGLHVGWAIEGAIGSELKIDVSYLSPNVNIAARLECATTQYGVPILFSGQI